MYTPIVWKEGFLLQTRFHLIPLLGWALDLHITFRIIFGWSWRVMLYLLD
jgi:hypothetical protein